MPEDPKEPMLNFCNDKTGARIVSITADGEIDIAEGMTPKVVLDLLREGEPDAAQSALVIVVLHLMRLRAQVAALEKRLGDGAAMH
jgi:hypothetical protein